MLLAMDTATQVISLALHDGKVLLAEQTWHSANNHTIELAPAIQTLLKQCDATIEHLTALAVASGPGSYTSLRIGVAMAKGLAAARSLPLVGVSTLDILALAQPQARGGLIVALPAGRGRIIAATYHWRKNAWGERGEPKIMDWDELFASIDGAAVLTGEIDARGQEKLAEAQARQVPVTLAPGAYRLRRAGFLAEEAWTRLNADRTAYPAAKLVPYYVKTADSP